MSERISSRSAHANEASKVEGLSTQELRVETAGKHEPKQALARSGVEVAMAEQMKKGFFGENVSTLSFSRTIAAGLLSLGIGIGDVIGAERSVEQPFTPEQIQTIERVTGMSFAELSIRFKIEMPLQAGYGNTYIVHIGQSHKHPQPDSLEAYDTSSVVRSQRVIGDFLPIMVKKNNLKGVFWEGIVRDEDTQEIRGNLERIKNALDAVTPDFFYSSERMLRVATNLESLARDPVYAEYLGVRLDEFASTLEHAMETFVPTTQESEVQLQKIQEALRSYRFVRAGHDSDAVYMELSKKLLVEKKVPAILAAEDYDLNRESMAAMLRVDMLTQEYIKKKDEVRELLVDDPEFAQLETEISRLRTSAAQDMHGGVTEHARRAYVDLVKKREELVEAGAVSEYLLKKSAEEDFNNIATVEREKVVLKRIDEYDMRNIKAGYALGNVALVYGSGHDFSKVLSVWNSGLPLQGDKHVRGLIKLEAR